MRKSSTQAQYKYKIHLYLTSVSHEMRQWMLRLMLYELRISLDELRSKIFARADTNEGFSLWELRIVLSVLNRSRRVWEHLEIDAIYAYHTPERRKCLSFID